MKTASSATTSPASAYAPLRSASKSASTKVAVPPPKKASSFSITSSRNFSRSRSLVTSAMT